MSKKPPSIEDRLYQEGYCFSFFQAVRILTLSQPHRRPVGQVSVQELEVAFFRAHLSLSFPPSQIYDVTPPRIDAPTEMIVSFLGLTGPSGVMPAHYTEQMLRLEREGKGAERYALRDWLDIFNHRFISLFYRCWEKYRFIPVYERSNYFAAEIARFMALGQKAVDSHVDADADPFSNVLYSLVGLGTPRLRDRLRVDIRPPGGRSDQSRTAARIPDPALLFLSGLFAQRPRNAVGLEIILGEYFRLPVRIQQFRGQWLRLDVANQSRTGGPGSNNAAGVNLVAGERVWDVQSKIRIRIGPMRFRQFTEFLPDKSVPPELRELPGPGASFGLPTPAPQTRFGTFFLLVQLARLYLGPELDFDVQLVLDHRDVPECKLAEGDHPGSRLGWNSWVLSQPAARDADDAVFEAEEVTCISP